MDYGSTNNFIDHKLAKINLFVYPTPMFQAMIANGGTILCWGKCHSIKLPIFLDNQMI